MRANAIDVFVVSVRAAAPVDLGVEDGVERAHCAATLIRKLSWRTGKHTDTAAVERISCSANALAVGDDLVVSASVAVSLVVEDFVRLALADARGALQNLAGRAATSIVAVVYHVARADRTDSVDQETVGKRTADGANLG